MLKPIQLKPAPISVPIVNVNSDSTSENNSSDRVETNAESKQYSASCKCNKSNVGGIINEIISDMSAKGKTSIKIQIEINHE